MTHLILKIFSLVEPVFLDTKAPFLYLTLSLSYGLITYIVMTNDII